MQTIHQKFSVNYDFPIIFTRDVFQADNPVLAEALKRSAGKKNRILPVIDSEVVRTTPKLMENIERYADRHSGLMELAASPVVIPGGEICKQDPAAVEKIHALVNQHKLCRHSFALVIGGGAVLDAAGYAAATAHRGIRLIRMPTTTLSQNDAGVGVKNGINAYGRKNFLGTFAPPFAVINDFTFLNTLPDKVMRAGISEAIKVALIKDSGFFDFLYTERGRLAAFEADAMEKMIIRCAELHSEHIRMGADPFEHGSSRPLDFGHWAAHKIEELTGGEVPHGDAVAIGVALDSLYSHHVGLINEIELHKIFSVLEDIGFNLYNWSLNWIDIDKALQEFQEHLGGELTIPLLSGLGQKTDAHEIDTRLLKECVAILTERNRGKEHADGAGIQPDVGQSRSGNLLP